MSALDDQINSLSSDELDMLNNDPKMLADFKAKYAAPPTATENVLGAVGSQLKTSLLPDPNKALNPLSGSPGEMLGQALNPAEGLTRMGQTLRQPSVEAGKTVEQFGKDINAPVTGKIGGFMAQTALDPATYAGTSLSAKAITEEAIPKAKNFLSSLGDMVTGAFKEPPTASEIEQASKNVQEALVKAQKQAGTKLGVIRGTSQPAEARLEEIANKGVESYTPQEVAKNIQEHFANIPTEKAPVMGDEVAGATTKDIGATAPPLEQAPYTPATRPIQKGDTVTLKATDPQLPDVQAMHNGPHTVPGNTSFQLKDSGIPETDPAKIALNNEMNKKFPDLPQVETPMRHGPESDVASGDLQKYGYQIPSTVELSPKEELDKLLKLRSNAYDQINATTLDQSGNVVKKVSSNDERAFYSGIDKINKRIENLPGGDKIRAAEKEYSEMSKVYGDLQSKMKEPGQAEGFLKSLFNKPTGKNKDYLEKLGHLQEVTKEPVLDNLFNLYKTQAQGLNYEMLKHPVANLIKQGLPNVAGAIKTGLKSMGPVIGLTPNTFPLSDENRSQLQSAADRIKFRDTKYAKNK